MLHSELPEEEITDMKAYFDSLEELEAYEFGNCLAGEVEKAQVEKKVQVITVEGKLEQLVNRILESGLIDREFER